MCTYTGPGAARKETVLLLPRGRHVRVRSPYSLNEAGERGALPLRCLRLRAISRGLRWVIVAENESGRERSRGRSKTVFASRVS